MTKLVEQLYETLGDEAADEFLKAMSRDVDATASDQATEAPQKSSEATSADEEPEEPVI